MLWMNGRQDSETSLVLDEGLLFGRGVFETLRVGRQPFFWYEHLARLNEGLAALKIRPALDPDDLLGEVQSLQIRDCVLKIVATPANLILQTRPLPAEPAAPWRLTAAAGYRTASRRLLGSKNLNYLDNLLAWENARQEGYDDALWLNAAGQVAETSRANLFFFRGSQLLTPDPACGLLDGIVRQWVIRRFPVQTGYYRLSDLLAADAVFVTNSVAGIQPVGAIEEHGFADSPLTGRIRKEYREFLGAG
jgi:4-amino-4-deoxychorismate lyase